MISRNIIKFIARVGAFSVVFTMAILVYFYVFMSNIPVKDRIGAGVYYAINKSLKANKKTKKLVIGDSVAAQLYPNQQYNDTINSLACNHAVTLVGYYNMLANFLDNYEGEYDSLKVYFIYRPSSFRNNLDQRYTFNYFLKPFFNDTYNPSLTNAAKSAIEQIPFYWLSKYDFIKRSNWAPLFRTMHNPHDFKMAPIAAEYLKKCEKICQEKGVSFEVICPFMSNEFAEKDFDKFKEELVQYEVNHLFKDYFKTIVWLDKKKFNDGAHLHKIAKKEIITYNFLQL